MPCTSILLLMPTPLYPLIHRAKHPVKVHVWAGISLHGRTGICIFDGIMKATIYTKILGKTLVPFIKDVYPSSHKFMANNDPKHMSRYAQRYL